MRPGEIFALTVMRRTHSSLLNGLEVQRKLVADQLGAQPRRESERLYTVPVELRKQASTCLNERCRSLNGVQTEHRKNLVLPEPRKFLERETGIEPATSSLGNWQWIGNSEHSVFCIAF